MVSNSDRGEQDRYGRWFPPFPPAPAPASAAPDSSPDAAETGPQDASWSDAGDSTGMMFSPDNKAPAAASDPRASRDAPTPTWLSADQGPDTTVSPRKPRKPKKPKPQKPPKAAPAPTPPPQPAATPAPTPAPEPVRAPAAAVPLEAPQSNGGRSKRPLIVGAAAAAVVAVGALVVGLVLRPDTLSSSDADTAQSTAAADSFCAESESNGKVVSNQPGDQSNGVNAILAFEYAYYVERDAKKAREVVTPDAEVGAADRLQSFIDDLPSNTEYCAEIEQTASDQFLLNLHVKSPGLPEYKYPTGVRTTEIDGKTFITYMGKPL